MMSVEGVDLEAGAYRVALDHDGRHVRALVPESALGGTDGIRPSHRTAYETLSAHAKPIRAAVAARLAGRTPRAPWDGVRLVDG